MIRRRHPHPSGLTRVVTREIGMASAVLAIWLLSLLAPMHLVSRMATELRMAGYDVRGDWSLCLPSGLVDDDGRPITLCPGKTACGGGVLPSGARLADMIAVSTAAVFTVLTSQFQAPRFLKGSVQPRAPPVVQFG